MKKKLKWIVGIVALVLVVGLVILYFSLNSIVRVAVEKGSTQQLQIPTTLGGASLNLFSGDVSLDNYVVASPEGFTAPHMLSLGKLAVDTSYGKVMGEPKAIDSITIDKPQLVLEFKGTQSNLKAVADKLASGTGGDQTPAKTDPNAQPMKLIIDNLAINGASVVIKTDLLGGKEYTIDVPPIQMQNIGNADGNKNGEEIGKVASQIISRLTVEAQKSGKLPPELAAILNGDLNQLVGKIGGQFQEQMAGLQKQAQEVQAQVTHKVDEVKAQATEQIDKAKGQLEDQTKKIQNQAQDQLNKLGGGLLGGGKKSDDKK